MKLSDVRKVTVRKRVRIGFHLPNGMECVLDEHGIARIPGLQAPPDFNLDEQFSQVTQFLMEPVLDEGIRNKPKPESMSREQLTALVRASGPGGPADDDHDE
ncbi:MAG: hypothetical protein WD696_10260 [Bryobacteraceae bacterium]